MGFLSKLFGKSKPNQDLPEHALIVTLKLSNDEHGSDEERNQIHELTDKFDLAINEAGVGEFDGDKFGDGNCILYMYGTDVDRLFAIVDPLLRASQLAKGAIAIKRYGDASNHNAKEEKIQY